MKALALIPAYSHIDHRLHDALRRVNLPHMAIHGCSDLVRARCRLLSDGLRTDADRFVFLDSDMVPTPEQLTALVESDRVTDTSAATGAYVVADGKIAASGMSGQAISLPAPERYVACLVAGMGFASVARSSVERLAGELPVVHDPDGAQWRPFFLPMLVGETHEYLSEDYSFWWRLHHQAGVTLWLDTSLVIGHCKRTVVMPGGA